MLEPPSEFDPDIRVCVLRERLQFPNHHQILPICRSFDTPTQMSNPRISTETLILASKSPRRHALLSQAGLSFTVIPSTVDERDVPKDRPVEYVTQTAKAKAEEVSTRYPEHWVIGADTAIVLSDHILGKPGDTTEARWMLSQLNNTVHTVFTGYCISCKERGRFLSGVNQTEVEFRRIRENEMDWYIGTGEPFGKAGGYAVQGLGGTFVKRIVGSYTNVVGLPLCEVVACLMEEGAVRRG